MKKQMGRDLERVREKKAAPSHSAVTHKIESDKNKQKEAFLKTKDHGPIKK